jgi:hypothetical protein
VLDRAAAGLFHVKQGGGALFTDAESRKDFAENFLGIDDSYERIELAHDGSQLLGQDLDTT